MMSIKQNLLILTALVFLITSCGSSKLVTTPIENIDNTPIKYTDLTDAEEKIWGHLDFIKDTIPGMSIQKAYDEIIKNKKGTKVIVAVIDSGIDIDHEDLDGVIWRNKKEIAGNGKDDDNNGYVDDIHGWNFLGDTYNEQLEYVRLLASGDTNNPRYSEAQTEYQKDYPEAQANKTQYEQIFQQISTSDTAIAKHLKKEKYTKKEVVAIKTEDQALLQHKNIIIQTYSFDLGSITEAKEKLKEGIEYFTDRLNFNLNKEFKGRKTGDNPDDYNDKSGYGNGNVKPVKDSEAHGTHVAGIIAAERNNGKGVNGVANNVEIMSLRAIPNGDEYDKDVALAIRYAVDNGAKIINTSFGKYFSPHSDWVRDAIAYAGQNDVLIVNAAGNESFNLDQKECYPNDQINNDTEVSKTFLSVGATDQKYGSSLVASYSNYGKNTVDVFAPGSNIYSTYPNNTYKPEDGTSMAAPAVSGVAALIRSQYPKLTATQVKQIIMDSGLPLKAKVTVGENGSITKPFNELSKSSKLVNAYNALIMASKISN